MKKRVLLLSGNELCVAGVPNVIMNITENLSDTYVFDILTFSTVPGESDQKFLACGGHIYSLDLPRYPQHRLKCFGAYRMLRKKMKQLLRQNRYHVVHGHSGYYDGICLYAARKAGVPVRLSHGHGEYKWVGRNFLMRMYLGRGKKLILKNATQRLACSDVAGVSLFLNQSFLNVLNPVDVSAYANLEKIPHQGIHLLQIGYYCKLKNQMFSLRLLEQLRNAGIDAKLSLIGYPSEQDYWAELQHAVETHGMTAYVSFLPHAFDKRTAFAQADYCLLPSESEGLPLVALEAQSAGVPCLMSDNISKESNVGAGFFLPHNDVEKWAEAIMQGLEVDPAQLAQNLERVSTQAYMERIRETYEQKQP